MINLGIIGAGRIGKVHIESISTQIPNAKVKMLADPFMDEEKEAWAKGKGVEQVTKDYHEILNNPEIDAVLICSSTERLYEKSCSSVPMWCFPSSVTCLVSSSIFIKSSLKR